MKTAKIVRPNFIEFLNIPTPEPEKTEVLIKVMKDGYDMRFITTSRSLSTLGMLDVVGGAAIIIPLIGLLSPAAWRHQPPTCMFKLTPVGR